MEIRRASAGDIGGINALLRQVLEVHHRGRPDIFRGGTKKYTDAELTEILTDDERPVFAAFDGGSLTGYVFCIAQKGGGNILTDIRTLYIDDLCVDESRRGEHIGTALYRYVVEYARSRGFYNVTLNVWTCNEAAMRFYGSLGMKPQKICMETIL